MYKYCPKCGGELKLGEGDFAKVPVCTKCGFKFFQNSRPTAAAIVTNDLNQVLLIKRATEPNKGKWALIGGFLENGEPPEDGLRRELLEEVGIEVTDMKFIGAFINKYLHDPSLQDSYTLDLFFTAKALGDPKPLDEVDEVRWASKDEKPWEQIAFDSNIKALKKFFKIS